MTDSVSIQDPPLARGRTADVYAWHDGQVIKLFYDWVPDSWIERETDIARALPASSLPVPKFIEAVSTNGRRGIVFQRIHGPSMVDLLTTRPWHSGALARRMAELHALVHAENGRTLDPLRAQVGVSIEHTEALPEQLKRRVLQHLDRLPDGTALCHFDFHPAQIIMSPQRAIILDWMAALKGDPAADVARTSVLLTFAQVPDAGVATRLLINVIRRSFHRSYLARYLALQPEVTRQRINDWMIPVAAARLNENVAGEREAILRYLGRSLEPG